MLPIIKLVNILDCNILLIYNDKKKIEKGSGWHLIN